MNILGWVGTAMTAIGAAIMWIGGHSEGEKFGEEKMRDRLKAAPAFVDHKPGKTRVMAIDPSAVADMISEYGNRELTAKIIDDYACKNPGTIMWSETWDVDDD